MAIVEWVCECGYGGVYAGDPVWVCTGWEERIGKKETVSETGGGVRFERRDPLLSKEG